MTNGEVTLLVSYLTLFERLFLRAFEDGVADFAFEEAYFTTTSTTLSNNYCARNNTTSAQGKVISLLRERFFAWLA